MADCALNAKRPREVRLEERLLARQVRKTRRAVGYRPTCFFAALTAFGVLVGSLMMDSQPLYRLLPLGAALVLFAVLFFCSKLRRYSVLALGFVLGLLSICGYADVYRKNAVDYYGATMTCTVSSEIVVGGEDAQFEVDEIFVGNTAVRGEAKFYAKANTIDFAPGDRIVAVGNLQTLPLKAFSTDSASSYVKNRYRIIYAEDCGLISDSEPKFPLSLELRIKRNFFEHTDNSTAAICCGLILGDLTGASSGFYDDVKAGGIAHLFAVSGLHFSVLAAALWWLLRKFKLKEIISAVVVTAVLVLYAVLVGFRASVVRALIMTVCMMFAGAFGRQRDSLSALSFSAVILLCVNPMFQYDVGFLLSYLSVLGILLFYRSIAKGLRKLGKKLGGLISTSVSANLLTLPLCASVFGSTSLIFVAVNMLILPIMTFIYVFLLIITLFALIPGLSGVLFIFDYIFMPFKALMYSIGSIPAFTMNVNSVSLVSVGICLSLILCSRFVYIKKRPKLISSVLLICVSAITSHLAALL